MAFAVSNTATQHSALSCLHNTTGKGSSVRLPKGRHRLTDPLGFGELLHGLLEVAKRPLHQALILLEVVQQHIPQRLLGQHLRVAQDDQAVLGPGQGYIETPGVTEETYSLQVVCIHRSEDGRQLNGQTIRQTDHCTNRQVYRLRGRRTNECKGKQMAGRKALHWCTSLMPGSELADPQ